MTQKTKSEILFEAFCELHHVKWQRVPTCDVRTPDYDIVLGGQKIVAEVKQIDPNPPEKQEARKLLSGGVAEFGGTLGARIRKKITDASPQIAKRAKGKFPSLLVLYNNVLHALHTGPENVLAGMYGEITAVLAVPQLGKGSPYLKEWKLGAKRKMTKAHNTSISAIGALMKDQNGHPYLVLYHNVFANIPLAHHLFRSLRMHQFTLEKSAGTEYPEWVDI
ncbi:MAG: hypothetical protein MN733_20665 [Nitrososphaera sp.]|nr:hypothetical protein [Nitrososphaera sp.]